jgi:hypothetical protein
MRKRLEGLDQCRNGGEGERGEGGQSEEGMCVQGPEDCDDSFGSGASLSLPRSEQYLEAIQDPAEVESSCDFTLPSVQTTTLPVIDEQAQISHVEGRLEHVLRTLQIYGVAALAQTQTP